MRSHCSWAGKGLGLGTGEAVGDSWTSLLCWAGDRPARAWLQAEQGGPCSWWHSHLRAVAGLTRLLRAAAAAQELRGGTLRTRGVVLWNVSAVNWF